MTTAKTKTTTELTVVTTMTTTFPANKLAMTLNQTDFKKHY